MSASHDHSHDHSHDQSHTHKHGHATGLLSEEETLAHSAATTRHTSVETRTACLALMDTTVTATVWEDLLFDGDQHSHAPGGLLLNRASLATHLPHDGHFPVTLHLDDTGLVLGLDINLDPYSDDEEDAHHTRLHGNNPTGHSTSTHPDGWTTPTHVHLTSAHAVLGDPSGLPEADAVGGLLNLHFPSSAGLLRATTRTQNGTRTILRATWQPSL